MGEFGRTPKINPNTGRDHYPNAWSTVLAGGGIRGGQVVGRTSADGTTVAERPVSVPDLLATVCQALGIDPMKQNISNVGRPIRVVDPSAKAGRGDRGMRRARGLAALVAGPDFVGGTCGVARASDAERRALPPRRADTQDIVFLGPHAAAVAAAAHRGRRQAVSRGVAGAIRRAVRAWKIATTTAA